MAIIYTIIGQSNTDISDIVLRKKIVRLTKSVNNSILYIIQEEKIHYGSETTE